MYTYIKIHKSGNENANISTVNEIGWSGKLFLKTLLLLLLFTCVPFHMQITLVQWLVPVSGQQL